MDAFRSSKRIMLAGALAAVSATILFAELRKGDYSPSQLGTIPQAAPPVLTTDGKYAVAAYPAPAPDLVAGDGVAEVRIYCATCHSPRYITMQPPLPPPTWEAEVNKMKKAFGANIPDETTRKIIAYLEAHYATGTR